MAVTEENKQLVGVQPTVPVVKPNAFAVNMNPIKLGGVAPKQSKSNNDMQFLDAIASDRLSQRDYENQVAEYNTQVARKQAGDPTAFVGEAPQAPNPFLSKTLEFNRQQQAHEATKPNPGRAVPYEEFRQKMQEKQENEEAIKANKRAMVYAIGDALRQMGNLYYTTKGSTPQNYGNVNMAEQTLTNYKQERAQREAKRYQEQKDRLAQRQLEYENARKDAEFQFKVEDADRNFKLKYGQYQLDVDKNDRETMKLAQELQNMEQQRKNLIADGKKKEADALTAQMQSKYAEAKNKSEIFKNNAAGQSSMASAEKTRSETSGEGNPYPKYVNGKRIAGQFYHIKGKPEDVKKSVVANLARKAVAEKWYNGQVFNWNDPNPSEEPKVTDMYNAIMAHADDSEVQSVLSELSKLSGGTNTVSSGGGLTSSSKPRKKQPQGNNGGNSGGKKTRVNEPK